MAFDWHGRDSDDDGDGDGKDDDGDGDGDGVAEMEKVADAADMSVLFFSAGANF